MVEFYSYKNTGDSNKAGFKTIPDMLPTEKWKSVLRNHEQYLRAMIIMSINTWVVVSCSLQWLSRQIPMSWSLGLVFYRHERIPGSLSTISIFKRLVYTEEVLAVKCFSRKLNHLLQNHTNIPWPKNWLNLRVKYWPS